jgi:integrase
MKSNTAPEDSRTIVKLEVVPKPKRTPMTGLRQRFKITSFPNRGGSQAWRVEGTPRNGKYIRENYADLNMARQRQIQLEGEYHSGVEDQDAGRRATKLTDVQLRLCETALHKLDSDDELLPAVDYWLRHGKGKAVSESPRLDNAFEKFTAWLDGKPDENGNGLCTLREHSRKGLRIRVKVFCNSVPNLRVNDITPDTIEDFIGKLRVSPTTRDNYRRAVSRFFSWCIQRPRRWTTINPCHEVRVERGERQPPAVLTLEQCTALLKAAEPKGLAPYVSVCLFAGLRPFEASRLDWDAVNLKDREIRLEGYQTKTGRSRVVAISKTLAAWLEAHSGESFFPSNWRKAFDSVKEQAGFGTPDDKHPDLKPWPVDVMRNTAVSHYFRHTGSYGQTAEQFGNSEAIIKTHYQGRVSSDDTKAFYSLRPTKGANK